MPLHRPPQLAGTPSHTLSVTLTKLRACQQTRPATHLFVGVLNAWDDYEVDVLKALFHYRPPPFSRNHADLDYAVESFVDSEVHLFPDRPRSLLYANPGLIDWLNRVARDPFERQWAFAEVFGIEVRLGPDQDGLEAFESIRNEWSEQRNAILMEQTDAAATFNDYAEATMMLRFSTLYLADECRTKHNLVV